MMAKLTGEHLVILLLLVGIALSFFQVDAKVKQMIYLVLGVAVFIWVATILLGFW